MRPFLAAFLVVGVVEGWSGLTASSLRWRGVNLSAGEYKGGAYGTGTFPGVYNTDYTYPSAADGYNGADYFLNKGMNIFRMPFRWERIQPLRTQPLDAVDFPRLKAAITELTDKKAYVLMDMHNYARYKINTNGPQGQDIDPVVGSPYVPISHLVDVWSRIAAEFLDNPYVIFGIMNEPHSIDNGVWMDAIQQTITAIRLTGATNYISVMGNGWGSTWWYEWRVDEADKILEIKDPIAKTMLDVHVFFDENASGAHDSCESVSVAVERLNLMTPWLKEHNQVALISEMGVALNSTCYLAMKNMMEYLFNTAPEQYTGFIYWAAGPWWGTDPTYDDRWVSIEPNDNGSDRPQMQILNPYLYQPGDANYIGNGKVTTGGGGGGGGGDTGTPTPNPTAPNPTTPSPTTPSPTTPTPVPVPTTSGGGKKPKPGATPTPITTPTPTTTNVPIATTATSPPIDTPASEGAVTGTQDDKNAAVQLRMSSWVVSTVAIVAAVVVWGSSTASSSLLF